MDIFQEIVCRFGKLDIDLFASRLNPKLEKYISFRPDPNAMVVVAFSISWTKQYVYIFAFFSTLSMVLWKIVEDEAEALVIAPLWTTQNWWTQLAHLIVDFPIKLPPPNEPAKRPRKNSPNTETESGAFPVSGKFCKAEEFRESLPTSSFKRETIFKETIWMRLSAVRCKAVVLLLLTCCLLLLSLWDSEMVLWFVVCFFIYLLVSQLSWWERESWLLCLVCLLAVSWLLCVALPRSVMGKSAVCDCGISWSYSLF